MSRTFSQLCLVIAYRCDVCNAVTCHVVLRLGCVCTVACCRTILCFHVAWQYMLVYKLPNVCVSNSEIRGMGYVDLQSLLGTEG